MQNFSTGLASVVALIALAGCQIDEVVMAPNATPAERELRGWFSGASTEADFVHTLTNTGARTNCVWHTLYSTNGVYRQTYSCEQPLESDVPTVEIGRWSVRGDSLCRVIQRQDRPTGRVLAPRNTPEVCGTVTISGNTATILWPRGSRSVIRKVAQAR